MTSGDEWLAFGRHPSGHVEATGVVGRETMFDGPPRLGVASQHGMLTWACVLLAQEVILSRALVAVTFEAGAPQLQTDQAGLRRQPLPAFDGMCSMSFRCECEVVSKGQVTLQRDPVEPREPSKRVRNARRASERAKESDIDRWSFYL